MKLVYYDFMSLMESLLNQHFFRFHPVQQWEESCSHVCGYKKTSAAFYWLILSMNLIDDVLLFQGLTTSPFAKLFIYLLQLYDETIPQIKPTKLHNVVGRVICIKHHSSGQINVFHQHGFPLK